MERKTLALTAAAVVAVLIATVLVYVPGLSGPFVFDDLTNIVYIAELRIDTLSADTLSTAATAVPQGLFGRPIAYISFALNYYFTGLDPFFFKLTNVFIHLFTALGLFFLCYLISKRLRVLGYASQTNIWLLSVIICAIWALQPLNLTSVLYVVQRMTSLAAFFMVLSLIGYVVGREQLLKGFKRGFATILGSLTIFGGMALLTKENGALFFVYALVIELTLYRLAGANNLSSATRALLLGLFIIPIVIAIAILAFNFEHLVGGSAYMSRPFTLYERILTEARALWFYARLIVLPDIRSLGLYHDDFLLSQGLLRPLSTIFAVASLVALAIGAMVVRLRQPVAAFGVLWFLGGHLLESTVIPLELVHEHRNYLPAFGIVFMVAYYATSLAQTLGKPAMLYGFLALYVALLGSATYARSRHWSNEWDLYHKEAANHPHSSRAHTMLGILYHDNKLYPAAEHEFRLASNLNPASVDPLIRLAQHQFIAKEAVDREVLTELEKRLNTSPITTVTLYVIDPFIKLAVKDRQLSNELLRMYTATLKRRDINIEGSTLAVAAANTALAYMKLRDFAAATDLYTFALERDPRPLYVIGLAEAELGLGRAPLARQAIRRLEDAKLDADEQKRLETVRQRLAAIPPHLDQ